MRPKKRVSTYYNSFRKLWAHRFDPTLPTMFDLPYENPLTDGLPDSFHRIQPQLLSETFVPPNYPHQQILMATNLYLYYDLAHTLRYKIPDWFVVLGVPRGQTVSELRLSYVMWQENVAPYFIVELLSPGTEDEDLGPLLKPLPKPSIAKTRTRQPKKWKVYEQILQVPYYLVYDRYTEKLQAFQLVNGRYSNIHLLLYHLSCPRRVD